MTKGSVSLLADYAKDDNTIKDSDMINHSVCDQELPNGKLWGLFSAFFFSIKEYYILKISSSFSRRVEF